MFQEFKDEVLDPSLQPDINPRYTIRDNNGKVISDDVQIEMKTPVVQNPTPLSRAVVGNIQGDLYTQDRFNSLEIKQRILEVDYITDIVVRETKHTGNCIPQSGWVSKTEGQYYVYTSNGWQISDNNIGTQTNNVTNAFDGDTTTKFNAKNGTTLCTVTIDCPYPIKITKMKTFLGTGKAQDFELAQIRGYKDGNWVVIYSYGTSYQTQLTEITMTNPDYFDKYQIYLSTDQLGWAYMSEIEVSEYYTAVFGAREYYGNLDLPLTSYERNKKISIESTNRIIDAGDNTIYIDVVDNPYLNINNLGERKINGSICYGQKYNLFYNGENWDIENTPETILDYTVPSDVAEVLIEDISEIIKDGETFAMQVYPYLSASTACDFKLNEKTVTTFTTSGAIFIIECTYNKAEGYIYIIKKNYNDKTVEVSRTTFNGIINNISLALKNTSYKIYKNTYVKIYRKRGA